MSGRMSRVMALALLGAFGWGVWAFAISPALQSVEATKAELSGLLIQETRLKATVARLELETSLSDTDDLGVYLWQAKQAGEATARIQAALGEISRNNGIVLRSITPAAAPPVPYVEAVALRIEAEADLEQVADFVTALEQHSPVLLISRATLRRLNRPAFSEQPVVFFQIDLIAPYVIGEG